MKKNSIKEKGDEIFMENPFVKEGCLSLNASINKLVLEEISNYEIDEDLIGKSALEVFSNSLFIKEIKKNSEDLKLNLEKIAEKDFVQYLDKCLESEDEAVKGKALEIVSLFGTRLGVILLTLKKGEVKARKNREDWDIDNWRFWSQLENVILVGGLASSNIGKILKFCVEEVFKKANEPCYNIILSENSANVALKGCITYINKKEENKTYFVFDLGQTYIKRSVVTFNDGQVKNIEILPRVASRHVEWEFKNHIDEVNEAMKLNNTILNAIIDAMKYKKGEVGDEIVISIANYVKNGLLVNRGGYGKLRLIDDNYERYLSQKLSKRVRKKLKVKLVHDGTAMAANFSGYSKAVCISLGTVFGVGFPL